MTTELASPESPFCTRAEGAAFLRISVREIARLLARKKLTTYRVGKRVLLDLSELERFVRSSVAV